jgi:hypothetical protein
MWKRFFACIMCAFVISASAAGAHTLDLEGMLGAAVDAFKAVTLSDAEVRDMAAARKEMDSKNKLAPPTDPQAIRLARITRGISVDRGLRPDIKLYLSPDVNAFAMADGTIRVYSGLMKVMNDDEVCYVIGHEMGHVALGHTKATSSPATPPPATGQPPLKGSRRARCKSSRGGCRITGGITARGKENVTSGGVPADITCSGTAGRRTGCGCSCLSSISS